MRYFVYYLRVRLKVVPWDYDFSKEAAQNFSSNHELLFIENMQEVDGLFISNGPGDPEKSGAKAGQASAQEHIWQCQVRSDGGMPSQSYAREAYLANLRDLFGPSAAFPRGRLPHLQDEVWQPRSATS